MSLVDVRVDTHSCRAEHAQTPSTKVPNLDPLKRDDWRIVVREALGLLAPERQPNGLARLVYDLNVPLGELVR
jgi:hypothetical protein